MALKIGDVVTADPVRDDIVRAIDLGPHSTGWRLALDNGQDDHIEAITAGDGRFKMSFVDRGRRLEAEAPIDAETLKSVLINYLDGDTDWRDDVRLIASSSRGDRTRAARRISSKPPVWAIALVAIAFFGSPLVFYLFPATGSGASRTLPIAWIIGGPISIMLIAMIANKTLQFRRARQWPSVAGRITKSTVSASHQQSPDQPVRIVNLPTVEYEFSFNGQTYTGRRISIGEDTGGSSIEATLARYPPGAIVTVYCNPDDPENCVLERNAPVFPPLQGCATTLASLASIGYIAYWLTTHYDTVIVPLWATGHGRVVVIASSVGVVSLMAYFGSLIIAKQQSAPWPIVRGIIVDSRVQTSRRRGGRSRNPIYRPVVEYSYRVNGQEFRGRQIGPDDQAEDTLADAGKVVARFSKDSAVSVYYDASNPGDAMLEKPVADRPVRTALIIAAVGFVVAVCAGLVF
jgi:Protein of unknown function (DUF3592)